MNKKEIFKNINTMKLVQEFEHEFKGGNSVLSKCNVIIYENLGKYFICFENIGEGMSVTNASEIIASQIVAKFNLEPENCRFFETYREYNYDTFDEIQYKWYRVRSQNGNIYWEAKSPYWKPASYFKKIFFDI